MSTLVTLLIGSLNRKTPWNYGLWNCIQCFDFSKFWRYTRYTSRSTLDKSISHFFPGKQILIINNCIRCLTRIDILSHRKDTECRRWFDEQGQISHASLVCQCGTRIQGTADSTEGWKLLVPLVDHSETPGTE